MSRIIQITKDNFELYQGDILVIENDSFLTPWSLNAFRDELKNPVSSLWITADDKTASGYICFWLFHGEIHLMNVAVHRDKRRRGLGGRLLRHMIATGVGNGVEKIWLEVRPSNVIAQAIYQKLGFREIARRANYYRDSHEDAIVMARFLSTDANPEETFQTGVLMEGTG
jgi:ribosomal-protein-alanine N-acetyltransferase